MTNVELPSILDGEFHKWRRSHSEISEPEDINNGFCREFAMGVKDTITNHVSEDIDITLHEYGYSENGYTSHAHVWIEYDGKHYDAECQDGVPNPEDLPIFERSGVDPRD